MSDKTDALSFAATLMREARIEIDRLRAIRAEQQDFLNELREYFEVRQDADHNGTGYVANDEMKLLMELNRLFPEEGK